MKNIYKRAFSVILLALMLTAVFTPAVSAAESREEVIYKNSLREAGFPESYLDDLYALHQKFPNWKFEVLDVTGKSRAAGTDYLYTWDYCVMQELGEYSNDGPKRSLVQKSSPEYRDWSDPNMYDTGWYKASPYTVEYYMDPRNFLDEKQIFQFIDLSYNADVTPAAVEAICTNTFLSKDYTGPGAAKLDYNDMTYAEYFVEVGKRSEVNLNACYLAACILNEHGVTGTDSMINGKCGDKLWYYYSNKITTTDPSDGKLVNAPTSGYTEATLKNYNGYYNYFNFGAAGTGRFTVYKNGMEEAITGSPELASEWGGNPSWNAHYKAILGGAIKAREEYVGNHQNNFYLQKFNVNPDSKGNFWKQYMQNVMASESRTKSLYKAYSAGGILNGSHTFVIPVYEGMPSEKCDDLSQGQLMDKVYLYDSLTTKVASYDTIDLSKLSGQTGVTSNFKYTDKNNQSKTFSWTVYNGKKGSTLNLGKLNLSKYDYALIEYSTKANFVYDNTTYPSIIGFVSSSSNPYGGESGKYNLKSNIANVEMTQNKFFKAAGGYEFRAVAKVDLDTDYVGNVYLSSFTQKGFDYLVHNVVFVTLDGHKGTVNTSVTNNAVISYDKLGSVDVVKDPVTVPNEPAVTTPSQVTTAPVETPENTTASDTTDAVTTDSTDTTAGEDTTLPTDASSEDITTPTEDNGDTTVADTTVFDSDKDEEKEGLSTTLIIVIIVAAVIVLGGGAAAAVILIKKKK